MSHLGSEHTLQEHDVEKDVPPKPPMPVFPEGGWMGWAAVAGSWLSLFCTFGYANTWGAFQAYYEFTGYPQQSSSTIAWIGSIQLFLQFSLGAVVGPLYDKGYFRACITFGSVIYIVCLFMVSLCKEIWQVFLSQAIGIGIGIGFLFLPSISVLSQYFFKKRSLAIGIAVTGSSVGGIVLPIMLNHLIQSHGFEKAVQYSGYLLLGCLVVANALMHPRLPPNPNAPPKPSPRVIFGDKAYTVLILGLFFVAWGLFFPVFYLQVFAEEHGINKNLTYYTLAILNAASVFGRISPNFLADKFGPLNLLAIMTTGAGILIFAVFGAASSGGLIVVTILFGFFQGAFVSLMSPALIATAKGFHEIGIRMGLGFLFISISALTGTPITGALLDKYGFYAPIIWSGLTVLVGAAFQTWARVLIAKQKETWKV